MVSFEKTPLLEISVKAAAIEALGWSEYDRLPHRWIVKYEKAVAHADRPPADELKDTMDDYWVDPSRHPSSGSRDNGGSGVPRVYRHRSTTSRI